MVKICVISDTHTKHKKLTIPEVDVLIHCGDFTWDGNYAEVKDFVRWFKKQPVEYRILICGNHELLCDNTSDRFQPRVKRLLDDKEIIYLENSSVKIKGFKFYGVPWTPFFCDWAFNGIRDCDVQNGKAGVILSDQYKKIPGDTDIIICHGPPYDILDQNTHGERCGSVEMRKVIDRMSNLKLFMFGHLHEARGVLKLGQTTYINASSLDRDYKNIRQPITIHLDDNGKVNSIKGVKR